MTTITIPVRPRCGTCRYATDEPAGGAAGTGPAMLGGPKVTLCHRYPPTIISIPSPGGVTLHHAYPIVSELDWCGEHAATGAPLAELVEDDR